MRFWIYRRARREFPVVHIIGSICVVVAVAILLIASVRTVYAIYVFDIPPNPTQQ